MSLALPHIAVEIGEYKDRIALEGLADTGGCSTLAQKGYIMELIDKHPSVVKRLHEFKHHQQQNIKIGGIGGGIEITHLAEIKMPYLNKDGGCSMVVGLSDQSPIKMIYGLPWLLATDCVLHLSKEVCRSSVLGVNFKIVLKTPSSAKNRRPPVQAVTNSTEKLDIPELCSIF